MFEVAKRLKSETNAHKPSSVDAGREKTAASNAILRYTKRERTKGKPNHSSVINHRVYPPKDYGEVLAVRHSNIVTCCVTARLLTAVPTLFVFAKRANFSMDFSPIITFAAAAMAAALNFQPPF